MNLGEQQLMCADIVHGERKVVSVTTKVIDIAPGEQELFAQHDGWFFIMEWCGDAWCEYRLHKTRRSSRTWYERIVNGKAMARLCK